MKSFTKTTTITYQPGWIKFPFMKYDEQFKSIRDLAKYKCEECFCCDKLFELDEEIGLAWFKNVGNKVLCKKCCEELNS